MRVILLLGFCCWFGSGIAGRAVTLPAPHAKANVSCFDCHHEEKPTKPAFEAACIDCHGDAPAMTATTRQLPVNPHTQPKAPHPGPFACTDCHHQHRPAAVKCLECHPTFKFSVK
jgi:hypothetical protein